MKTKDRLDELEAQLEHLTNRIDNLRDEFVNNHIEKESKFKKPLIKDEKIRRAVRAWAEAEGIEDCRYVVPDTFCSIDDTARIEFGCSVLMKESILSPNSVERKESQNRSNQPSLIWTSESGRRRKDEHSRN